MSLPSDILRLFHVESAETPRLPLKTISDFFAEMDKSYSQRDALQVINAFKLSGDLLSFGNFPTSSRSPLKEMLMGLSFNEEKAMHGLYNFKIHGFSAIAPHLRQSVRPVVVELEDGTHDIGTCFLIGKTQYILTT